MNSEYFTSQHWDLNIAVFPEYNIQKLSATVIPYKRFSVKDLKLKFNEYIIMLYFHYNLLEIKRFK